MTNKFKIGDEVKIKKIPELIDRPWYHTQSMKIIAVNNFYYFTDYWHTGRKIDSNFIHWSDGITEECIEYSEAHKRKFKLERILNES
jgi:hypothetical protein